MPDVSLLPSADITLDLRGESCPYPLIHTLDALTTATKGQLLKVITDCPSSLRNIPDEMAKRQFQLAIPVAKHGADYVFYIRR